MTTAAIPPVPLRCPDRLYIDGDWVAPAGDSMFDVIDSHSEQLYFRVAEAQPADMDLAVGAARDLLVEQLGVSDAEGLMLQSLLCDLRVNQIVDPLKGMRVSIPRTLLKQLCF